MAKNYSKANYPMQDPNSKRGFSDGGNRRLDPSPGGTKVTTSKKGPRTDGVAPNCPGTSYPEPYTPQND